MSLKLCAVVFATSLSLHSFSQQKNQSVMATAGGISRGKNVVLEWTVGESVVEIGKAPFALFTQGFHQASLEVITSKSRIPGDDKTYFFNVSPNPASSYLNIRFEKLTDLPLLVSVSDINGKVLLIKNIPSKTGGTKIDVARFSAGAYFLRITDKSGAVQGTSTIIKSL